MNIFEISAIASPLFGAIAGSISSRPSGIVPAFCGALLGLVTGIGVYFAAIGFSAILLWVSELSRRKKRSIPFQELAALMGLFLPVASPFAAWAITSLIVVPFVNG